MVKALVMNTRIRNLLLLILLASCWGPSFLFIKFGLESFPPLTLVNLRILVAALILYVISRLNGLNLSAYRHHFFDFIIVAIFSCSLPFTLISMGELYIASSLAAIINSTVPIFTVIIAHFFIAEERLTVAKMFGILLGFFGVLIVFLPRAVLPTQSQAGGALLVFLSAVSYAIGMTYSRRFLKAVPFLVSATCQLVVASIILLPFTFFIDAPYLLPAPTLTSLGGVLGLAVFGTAIAFNTYYMLVQRASASYLSTATLLFPVIGIALGAIFLDEQLTWNACMGSGLILCGLAVANKLVVPFGRLRKSAEPSDFYRRFLSQK